MILFVILGITFSLLGIICFLTGFLLMVKEPYYKKHSIITEATIFGYDVSDNTKWDTPKITFLDNGKKVMCEGKSKNMNSRKYPPGTKVRITYLCKKSFGLEFYDARMLDDLIKPVSVDKVGKGLYYFGTGLAICATAMFIVASVI